MFTDALILVLFPALVAFAAASDLVTMTISNRVALGLVAGFFAVAMLSGMGLATMGNHLAAGVLVLAVGFVFFSRGWIGGGDAKLAAATALWLGSDQTVNYLVLASLFGGALTVCILRFRMMPLPAVLSRQDWAVRLHRIDAGVPYGIALAMAALMVYPHTAFMKAVGL